MKGSFKQRGSEYETTYQFLQVSTTFLHISYTEIILHFNKYNLSGYPLSWELSRKFPHFYEEMSSAEIPTIPFG